ncbi:MAG: hypothetical protein MUQ10_12740 [Anaerolineae bacterium]|nr:hypothetical protein [Anaerolineae bacterium]
MNTFNRMLLVILLLVAIPLCTLVLVFPVPVLQTVGANAQAMAETLSPMDVALRLVLGILAALVLNIILIVFIILELRRPKPKAIEVEQLAGGQVLVNVGSVADRLRYEVDLLPGVLRTKPRVTSKKGGVVVELDVEAAAGLNVSESAVPIVDLVQDVIENKLGLRMARPPKVQLHTVSYPKTHRTLAGQPPEVKGIRRPVTPEPKESCSDTLSLDEPAEKGVPGQDAGEEPPQMTEADELAECGNV